MLAAFVENVILQTVQEQSIHARVSSMTGIACSDADLIVTGATPKSRLDALKWFCAESLGGDPVELEPQQLWYEMTVPDDPR